MIIAISGKKGSGKSTIGEIFRDNGFILDSFANSVKDICTILFGYDRNKLEGITEEDRKWRETTDIKYSELMNKNFTPREAMILVGTYFGRNMIHPNIWIETLFNRYYNNSNKNLLITDLRFPNEYEEIKKRGGIIIRVNRFNNDNLHYETECLLDSYEFDYIIDNNGTKDELKDKINKIFNNLTI
jgi:hypothetical protein